MCGIFGFVSPNIRNRGEFSRFGSRLFVESQLRGRDASGFAAIAANNEFVTDKRPLQADTFVKISDEWKKLKKASSVSLIGHTRAATNGSPLKNQNNHPFHGRRYTMAHNGGIMGFRDIAEEQGFKLQTECDSELILHFLERRKDIRQGIVDTFAELDSVSMMAVCALERSTGIVHIFRNSDAPCFIMKVNRWNVTAFASTLHILADAANRVLVEKWADINNQAYVLFDGPIPAYHHIKLYPDGKVTFVNLKDSIKFRKRSRFPSQFGSLTRVFNGGKSSYEKDREESTNRVSVPMTNGSTTTLDVDKWSCFKCRKPLAGVTCHQVSHPKKSDEHVFICDTCYRELKDVAAAAVSSSKKNDEKKDELNLKRADLLKILPETVHRVRNPLKIIENCRHPKLDHELTDVEVVSHLRFNSMSVEQRLQVWDSMTYKRLTDMDEGEYLSYYNLLCQSLVTA